jgi:hypothetical protein
MEAPEGFSGWQVHGPADPPWAIRIPPLLNWAQAVIAGGHLGRASSGGTMAHWASGGRPGMGTVHMGARIFCGCRVPIGLRIWLVAWCGHAAFEIAVAFWG